VPRLRNPAPSYSAHKQSGRGRLVWYDSTGARQQKLLPGAYGSEESLRAKATLELEVATSPTRTRTEEPAALTMAELLVAYLGHAAQHYRGPNGKPTSEFDEVKLMARVLRDLYGDTTAVTFGPLRLKAARQKWVTAGLARSECNRRTNLVRRMFKWAASEELVPATVHQALTTVTGLQRGRTEAREPDPVGPVDDAVVDATLPFLNRHVRGLVEFQRLTGCRPGEACALRRRDIDTGDAVWLYKPTHHKTAHRGKSRVIAIGPRAQELLVRFLTPDLDTFLFSPKGALEELRAARAAARKTPRYPSHMRRNAGKRKDDPRRAPKDRYDRTSYARAVARACESAFPPPAPLAQRADETASEWKARVIGEQRARLGEWRRTHHWHPNQLRHSYATRVRKEFGLEAAQVALGHTRASTTEIYAEKNEALAVATANKIG